VTQQLLRKSTNNCAHYRNNSGSESVSDLTLALQPTPILGIHIT